MIKDYDIYIISDSVGDTAEQVARAAAEQYKDADYEIKKHPYVESKAKIDDIFESIPNKESLVVYTIVSEETTKYLKKICNEKGLPCIDIMGPCLSTFSDFIGQEPARESGVIRKLDEDYFKRVEAVEFAVKYDDGKDPRGILKADIVLIGVSRSSKTPLSMYLAHKNYKVVNIPLVKGAKVPEQVYEAPRKKVIGLTIDPSDLIEIRRERIRVLGLDSGVDYVSIDKIIEELDYAEKIMRQVGCPVIDMTKKAVEEAANLIIDIINDLN
ncbi:kinase/pyrophosphorylase [Halanaerobium sp. Z-7514]|uniref:Putative pyruvate, phosphate dikinase regulatory protein n=1 Tax=Halanaerobium polyolivorans TaxID=2886943 RepID=A0AAW4WZQ7_9FIRM|nr:pyruvate, water dikinase regulatory protein [Halanaerobium polyolivorans]MCC3145012.1 kinase/pyrophosphorylase [Halanaerobium polyolivorans]